MFDFTSTVTPYYFVHLKKTQKQPTVAAVCSSKLVTRNFHFSQKVVQGLFFKIIFQFVSKFL